MNNVTKIKDTILDNAGKTSLVLSKYSPQILLGAGLVGVVATIFMAAKASTSLTELIEEHKTSLLKIEDEFATLPLLENENYSVMRRQQLINAYIKTGVALAKLYGPSIAVGTASIGSILGAHGILSQRNVGLAAAYNVVHQSFASYRQRVVNEYGDEVDNNFAHGMRDEEVIDITFDEEGKKIKTKKTQKTVDKVATTNEYIRYFDASSPMYTGDPNNDAYFLKAQQAFANQKLKAVGHVYLNDVLRALGYPDTKAGAVVGWLRDTRNNDNFIDFGIENVYNHNGVHAVLNFNVMGVMYDMV